jgi:5'-3' exonuclease
MGIPSYYRQLLQDVPELVIKQHPTDALSWLFMDYNGLIYHCLQRADVPAYDEDHREEWETAFLEIVVSSTLWMIRQVAPTVGVFLAMDGVVPMAKMRQQRLRRFTSVWLRTHDASQKQEAAQAEKGDRWDTNAITPGTVFMTRLRQRLERMIQEHGTATWHLSSSDEPGEGEHKILSAWRTGAYQGSVAVYGLDADLIVLSLLGMETTGRSQIWLFREVEALRAPTPPSHGSGTGSHSSHEVETRASPHPSPVGTGAGSREMSVFVENAHASPQEGGVGCAPTMEWFSVHALRSWLIREVTPVSHRTFLLSYIMAMSFLGNDFLPRSIGLTLRQEGHSVLIDTLHLLFSQGTSLVCPDTLEIREDGLLRLLRMFASQEETHIAHALFQKQRQARYVDRVPLGDKDWPLTQNEEVFLLRGKDTLVPGWENLYRTTFFPGQEVSRICSEYLYGIQWNWAYYTGRYEEVCFNWYYPFTLPPLWTWLCEERCPVFPGTVQVRVTDIRPVEQLAAVLPLESWGLIPPCAERSLPLLAPYWFPSSFSFHSVGKRFFWECEAMIPIPSIMEIKRRLAHLKAGKVDRTE